MFSIIEPKAQFSSVNACVLIPESTQETAGFSKGKSNAP